MTQADMLDIPSEPSGFTKPKRGRKPRAAPKARTPRARPDIVVFERRLDGILVARSLTSFNTVHAARVFVKTIAQGGETFEIHAVLAVLRPIVFQPPPVVTFEKNPTPAVA